ncbi:DNA-binding protein [Paenibacillus sp. KQZ6P-2]|uniref:DNA-binding protein n=1 Tax=Paenibacillus mangrovi TaxID=2931978 RepID=A0A9X2B3C7_9BACL|nr:DNA-binding protein [Paenibacillus mangrovi]MCJ8013246.1 DNA-binding protein [Paenibacillus mangrovi]
MVQKQTPPEHELPAGLAKPAQRALIGAGLVNLEHIAKVSEDELKQLHGIGPNALKIIRQVLEEKGLSFAEK